VEDAEEITGQCRLSSPRLKYSPRASQGFADLKALLRILFRTEVSMSFQRPDVETPFSFLVPSQHHQVIPEPVESACKIHRYILFPGRKTDHGRVPFASALIDVMARSETDD